MNTQYAKAAVWRNKSGARTEHLGRLGLALCLAFWALSALPALAENSDKWTIKGSYAITPTPPLEIGNQRQLLMDNYVVEDLRACRRKVHQPTKHPRNPLFSTGGDGLNPDVTAPYISVVRDEDTGLYRLWAGSNVLVEQPEPPGFYWLSRGRYFESSDGLRWLAPELGRVESEGSKRNSIFLGSPDLSYDSVGVSESPQKWRRRGRYLMIYNRTPSGRGPHPGLIAGGQELRLAFSDDGVEWIDQKENPIFVGQSDTANNLTYNPDRGVMMFYRRPPINAGEIRRIAYSESADLIHWSQPEQVLVPDELDPYSFYCMPVVRYQGIYLGFLHMFYHGPPLDPKGARDKYMMIDIQLAWSRDGKRWERHPERPIFLETGAEGSYDQNRVYVGKGLIEDGDRVEIYYTGHESRHISREVQPGDNHVCQASLRRDGFVSVEAPHEGHLLTKPIIYPGGSLHINGKVKPGGSIQVSIRRGDGEFDGLALPQWSYDQCAAFSGDSVDHTVLWEEGADLGELRDKVIRLEFSLKQAELFSFWFE